MEIIRRIQILDRIGDHFQGAMQWDKLKNPECIALSSKYFYKAEALIELLEIEDCGSIGGFDKGQPETNNLFDRWDWLYRKYNCPNHKRFGCRIVSYEDIKAFFHP